MGDALLNRKNINGKDPTDDFPYDVEIDMPATGKLDILYTADIHAGGNSYGGSRGGTKTFSLDHDSLTAGSPYYAGGDLKKYKDRLITSGRPTYVLDCGDATYTFDNTITYPTDKSYLPSGYSSGTANAGYQHTIDMVNEVGYLGIVPGNGEWKRTNMNTAMTGVNKLNNVMACNILDTNYNYLGPGTTSQAISYIGNAGGSHIIPGFKTMRVGNKKIAFIGVGFPSPNGTETYGTSAIEGNSNTYRWNYKSGGTSLYRGYDSTGYDSEDSNGKTTAYSKQSSGSVPYNPGGCVYRDVQYIINALKYGFGFDYIIVFCHLDKYTDENYSVDDRFFTRAEFLIQNTNGIDILIPGHFNQARYTSTVAWKTSNFVYSGTDYSEGISYKSGNCLIAYESDGEMNTIGRIEIDLASDSVKNRLLYNTDHLYAEDINSIPVPDDSVING